MSADFEQLPPPNNPEAFESLCLDLWKEIWGDPGAQKNGRSGQAQAGVDVFGRHQGRQMGVQCKQKGDLLRKAVSVQELEQEVQKALTFRPPLHTFTLATTGPADAKVQKRARTLTQEHAPLQVEVWSWTDIWHELYGRRELLERLLPIYWPRTAKRSQRTTPIRLPHAAQQLFGRKKELDALRAAWDDPETHVVTLVAWGGAGKTALIATWAAEMAAQGFDGADYFDWSFYSPGTHDTGDASADAFLVAALTFFGDPEMATRPASPWDKGAHLAQLVTEQRTLLVLDGLEPLQHPPGPLEGALKDPALAALLKGLAARNAGLCVVTSRAQVVDLNIFQATTAPTWHLEHLSTAAGVGLLASLGVQGADADLVQLVKDVGGHALTLNLLGRYLFRAHKGDVRRRDRVDLAKADRTMQGGHAFRAMAAYETWLGEGGNEGARQVAVLRLLSLFDRPATPACLATLRRPPMVVGLTDLLVDLDEEDWNLAVSALGEIGLVSFEEEGGDEAALTTHPLIREYFAQGLHAGQPQAWQAAHGRLFESLQESTEYRPEGLEALQPLYQAVVHGCLAGRQQEACVKVYRDRISRGHEAYVVRKLGAFGADLGAVACFFERPWDRISKALTEEAQAWLLNQAAFRLRALGRLAEAVAPLQATLRLNEAAGAWKNAAAVASNLSELELALGDIHGAMRDAEQSVRFADRSGDAFQQMSKRTSHAWALHQAGQRAAALQRFLKAEEIQAEQLPDHPWLYSVQGFQYCDLLLADVERAAWQAEDGADAVVGELYRDVEKRAEAALQIVMEGSRSRLDIALHHLTLGRAGLYRALLERLDLSAPQAEIEQAVDGLRSAGQSDELLNGLLTRAWLRALTEDPDGARSDLEEAWEIAARGPMPLVQADVLLHRARLFRDREALVRTRDLIEKHGYERRMGELEDAEAESKHW